MNTGRMEAFSDGVIAIIITIMVLDLHIPHGDATAALGPLIPVFLCYVLSFIYVGIYWNNHHHLLQATETVTGPILWANLHLLFWLSLFPFATAWMGENGFAPVPTALYGLVLLAAAIAFYILQTLIIAAQGSGSIVKQAVGRDLKGRLSPLFYVCGVAAAVFWSHWVSLALYVLVALLWLVPDRRIERALLADRVQRP